MRTPIVVGDTEALVLHRASKGRVALGRSEEISISPGEGHIHRASEIAKEIAQVHPAKRVFGAIGFDGDEPGSLWMAETEQYSELSDSADVFPGPVSLTDPDRDRMRVAIEHALEQIAAGDLRKVVLARRLIAEAARPFEVGAIAAKLHQADPSSLTYCVGWGGGVMVGSTPELLIRSSEGVAVTEAVAGSAPRHSDPIDDQASAKELLSSEKDLQEHRIVVEDIVGALEPFSRSVKLAAEPELRRTSRVWHLVTPISAELAEPVSSLQLAAALHPTPSICGVPRGRALEFIREREGFPRGLYCGLVGWTDANGDGEWAVALRCALVEGATATLYAGSGIVAGSEPEAELAETDSKMEVFLSAIGAEAH